MFENVGQFTEAELKLYAPQLRQFGSTYGFMICTVKSDNIDLKYKEKRNANNIANLTTNIPVKKYYVERFIITALKLDKQANGNPVIIFNENDNLRFPLSNDTCDSLLHVTKKEINDAIREYEDTKGEKVKFFTDIALCTQVVTELNQSNADALNTLAETVMTQADSLKTLNATMKNDLDEYLSTID